MEGNFCTYCSVRNKEQVSDGQMSYIASLFWVRQFQICSDIHILDTKYICERRQYKSQIMTTLRFRENGCQSLAFENFIIVCLLRLQSLLNHSKTHAYFRHQERVCIWGKICLLPAEFVAFLSVTHGNGYDRRRNHFLIFSITQWLLFTLTA